jgi:hypothetical protein
MARPVAWGFDRLRPPMQALPLPWCSGLCHLLEIRHHQKNQALAMT